ncbi:nucleotidyltransferase substrate binding protein [Aquibacillus sp. 3ASR75-11]|uniref:Nucleotidyltransferase substrate binding protein n=1 Tax=Terrihalobacillus insolitus TaxID=2950438 RepID=A0A9X3WWJ2_9BACI|nr:nucleotidyltransferase substrate binding protein [Terrihalobacillus insolitus]MDC3424709.1 nucleotidyltransferase substrate binding protein [Terrihalobacillus insolitus]
MSQEMINQSLVNLGKALNRLEEAVEGPVENQLMIDGVIQRFEFTIEQFWKTLKRILKSEGIQTSTPKESLQQAYKVGWINDEKMWLSMLKDRNLTSNTYDENVANEIYQRIKLYIPEMRRTYSIIKNYSTD